MGIKIAIVAFLIAVGIGYYIDYRKNKKVFKIQLKGAIVVLILVLLLLLLVLW